MSAPPTEYFKRQAVIDWLAGEGFAKHKIRELIENGTIQRNQFGYYSRSQIDRAVFNHDNHNTPPIREGSASNGANAGATKA